MKKRIVFFAVLVFIALALVARYFFAAPPANPQSVESNKLNQGPNASRENSSRSIAQAAAAGSASAHFPTRKQIEAKNAFLKKYSGDWKFNESESGEIRSLMGGTFPHATDTAEAALALIKELAPLLGAKPQDLRLSMIQPNDSSLGRSFRVEQTVDGFKVYQAQATVFGDKKTGDGFMINSSLRAINYDGTKPKLTALDAEQALLTHYKLEAGDAGLTYPEPMLVEVHPGQSELGWVFSTDLKDQGPHEVVISATTGQVLYSESRSAN